MPSLPKTAYLTLHGHFYQPPRENPWTDEIEIQPDAKPFHDWNERILHECYLPNTAVRVPGSSGKGVETVNNFELLSFNVGPTLLRWLERKHPEVYQKILEADRKSLQKRSCHGNAIAHIYNHMILPLASERDQRTQIRWGIFDFKKRFGRDPEGMWFPETAASERTLEILMEEGIRFTVLAPEQAEKIRPLPPAENSDWQEVSGGSIDPSRPYRFFHSGGDPARSLDLFFFDGPISRDVSFGDLLSDGEKFLKRILDARHPERSHPELIHAACDGETFGHHKKSGERTVASLLIRLAREAGFRVTDYGEYLEKFPPQFEVKIKPGEGTSWSCPHGVGRWKENCGCHTGGGAGWNQKWRRPLRRAVRFLGEKTALLYEEEGRNFFKDPWAARDDSIQLILEDSLASQKEFFEKHAPKPLSKEEKIKALKLLEMERFALLAETSCGWFFNDLSGIETVQILRYACRSLELAVEQGAGRLETEFVRLLSHAKSNRPEFGDGQKIWEKLVKPARLIW